MYSLCINVEGVWSTMGLFGTLLEVYAKYRQVRKHTAKRLLGAKVLLDGALDHVIF